MSRVPRCAAFGLCLALALSAARAAEPNPPPDLSLDKLIAPDVVFGGDTAVIRVALTSRGYTGRTVPVVVSLDGREVARKQVVLTGKVQFAELTVPSGKRPGIRTLTVAVPPLPGEAVAANNSARRVLRVVVAPPIKVLYVEAAPRWEYRYLRSVLLRDRAIDARFLLTRGDPALAKTSDRHLAAFPKEPAGLFAFDLVILGDVPAGFFTRAQLAALSDLVLRHGGALLVLAGQQSGLASYVGTPIQALLPVKLKPEGWDALGEAVHPVPTEAGWATGILRLAATQKESNALWARVRPLGRVPALAGAKPGAAVLATLSDAARRTQPYPLIASHRCGAGKVLFVGTDRLWRLRYREGDKHHARVWRQAIQLLAAPRAPDVPPRP